MKLHSVCFTISLLFSVSSAVAGAVGDMEYSPDRDYIAIAAADDAGGSFVYILDTVNYAPVAQIDRAAADLAFSPDGRFLAIVSVLDPIKERFAVSVWKTGDWTLYRTLKTTWVSPTASQKIAFVGTQKILAIARRSKRSQLWRFGNPSSKLGKLKKGIEGIASRRKGPLIAYGRAGRTRVYDTMLGKEVAAFGKEGGGGISYGKNGKLLASARRYLGRTAIEVYDPRTGKLVTRIRDLRGNRSILSFQPKGSRLANTGFSAPVVVYDSRDGTRVFRAKPYGRDHYNGVALSPDGGSVASGTDSGKFLVWNVASGNLIYSQDF